ncbi:MAG: ABC transporter permease [Steroidobacteraceae bacterium]
MNRNTWSVARFRFVATFRHRRNDLLALTVLVALLGGLAMGAVAAARSTQSSFPRLLAVTKTSQLSGISAEYIPGIPGLDRGYNPATIAKIAALPHVSYVDNEIGLDAFPLAPDGKISHFQQDFAITFLKLQGGYGARHDLPIGVRGHLLDPADAHQFVADPVAVAKMHLHLGQSVIFGIYTNAEISSPSFGPSSRPIATATAHLVGIVVTPSAIVSDDVDESLGAVVFSPSFARGMAGCCSNFTGTSGSVDGGPSVVAAVQRELLPIAPAGQGPFVSIGVAEAKAERAIKPDSIALGAFGAIVALAALLIAGQLIGRQLRTGAQDGASMRALGADEAMTSLDGLLGLVGALLVGSSLAVAVAIGLSPFAPFGPVRPYLPGGVTFDWTVLGGGVAILVVALGMLAVLLARRYSPRRIQDRAALAAERPSRLVSVASNGLPAPALVGVRFEVEPGRGADPVPVRSVIVGAVLAVMVVMSAVIFGSSLNSLVATPALYGWNWNFELTSEFGSGNIPAALADRLLRADPAVQAFSGTYFFTPKIDGQTVPALGETPGAAVQPPTLSGTGLEGPGQIVLGATTLASLHAQLGQLVTVSDRNPVTRKLVVERLRVVGTATMPTIGQGTSVHLEMGSGALVASAAIPAPFRVPVSPAFPGGPDAIFVRLKPGVSESAQLATMKRIARATGNQNNAGVAVKTLERPAEIVNYKSLGATPAVLGAALAGGMVVALGLTLLASVRRRRRDLALLKTLGFTTRQVVAVLATQATVSVAIGALVGIPLGIVAGRALWDLFANDIHAVPLPNVSVLVTALIALGALVVGNAVAVLPGRIAARTPAGVLLTQE